jgi:hypothetical protein
MPPTLIFTPSDDESANQPIVDTLDSCGLDYRIERSPGNAPSVACGADSLTGFSKQQLADFLRAHGAKFEDS